MALPVKAIWLSYQPKPSVTHSTTCLRHCKSFRGCWPLLHTLEPRPLWLSYVCQSWRTGKDMISRHNEAPAAPRSPHAVQAMMETLGKSNDAIPCAIVASAATALVWPAAFAWVTPDLYSPLLGYLMFSVGVNLSIQSFVDVFQHPQRIAIGTLGQWGVKPAVAWLVASAAVPALQLPDPIRTGLILVGCVSGAQLSNYAVFLAEPEQAALAIVLTALSTAAGVAVTPLLAMTLLGAHIPVDASAMALSIAQIVVVPVSLGLLFNRFAPATVNYAKPMLASGSLLDTCVCVGGSLAPNAAATTSLLGLKVTLPVVAFHGLSFLLGWRLARGTVAADSVPLARALTLSTGMQSSVLAVLLASQFFPDPLVRLTCGISLIIMTLGGFGLVLFWRNAGATQP